MLALPRCATVSPARCLDRLSGRPSASQRSASALRKCIDPVKSCSCYKEENVAMSGQLDDNIKRWTAKRKSALVIEIIQGKTTVAEASRTYDLAPSEIENWVDDARKGMENALRANPLDVRQEYEKQLRGLQEAYGEAMLELRARKKFQALMEREDDN